MSLDLELLEFCAAAYPRTDPDFTGADCRAFLYPGSQRPALIFAGSRTPEDWLVDALSAAPAEIAGLGLVAGGFGRDALAVLPAVLARLSGTEIDIAGHSKGGAEAQSMAALLAGSAVRVVTLITFGAPRVGPLASRIKDLPGTDWKHAGDPVPSVPPFYAYPRPVHWIGTAFPEDGDPAANHHLTAYRTAIESM